MKVKAILLAELDIEDESPPLSSTAEIEAELSRRLDVLEKVTRPSHTLKILIRRPDVVELDEFVANEVNWLLKT